jgi:hypothetical protein
VASTTSIFGATNAAAPNKSVYGFGEPTTTAAPTVVVLRQSQQQQKNQMTSQINEESNDNNYMKHQPIQYESSTYKVENISHIYQQLKGTRNGTDQEKENTRRFIENMEQKKDCSSIPTNDLAIYAIHNVFEQMGIDVCLTDSKLEDDESLALHSRVWLSGLLDLKIYETKFETNGIFNARSINSNKDLRNRFISEFKTFICSATRLPRDDEINVIEIKEGSVSVIFSLNAQLDCMNLNQSVYKTKTPLDLKYLNTNSSGLLDSGLLISKDIFDQRYDMDYTSSRYRGLIEKRGGEDYHFPFGWKRMALKMSSFGFTDLSWLTMNNSPNEWSMAYHGIGSDPENTLKKIINDSSGKLKQGPRQACAKSKDINERGEGCGKECGVGVYCTNKIETAERYTTQVDLNGEKVKIVLQCRINPKKFRNSGHIDNGGGHYYIINNSEDIRPYGILLKIS